MYKEITHWILNIWYAYPYLPEEVEFSGKASLSAMFFWDVELDFWTGITPARYVRNTLVIKSTWLPTGIQSEAVMPSEFTKDHMQVDLKEVSLKQGLTFKFEKNGLSTFQFLHVESQKTLQLPYEHLLERKQQIQMWA